MKILLIDDTASFVDFAIRAMGEGHEVKAWMRPPKKTNRQTIGDGLVSKVSQWEPWMRWADLILISDNVRNYRFERYRKEGYPIFSSGVEGASWELERGTGQELFKSNGISVMESTLFSNYDKAIDFVKKNPDRWVSKPTGDADKALSYVSKSAEDMIFMLDRWKQLGKLKAPFLLQKFVPGIEMAVGAWIGPNGSCSYVLENFEFKKLMSGDFGVNTGEMGTLMKYVHISESRLAQKVLTPLIASCIRTGYTGYIDVAAIISEKDGEPYPLEFTSRFGWPLFQIQQVLHPDKAKWMKAAMEGRDEFFPSSNIAAGIIIGLPPFPYNHYGIEEVSGFPIWGIDKAIAPYFHPAEVKVGKVEKRKSKGSHEWVKEDTIVSAGNYLCIVSGEGKTVSKAAEMAYTNVKKLTIPNSPIVRDDVGEKLKEQLPKLHKLGYAESWEY